MHAGSAGLPRCVGRVLIDRGADVNATAGDNITPLHLAACDGHREMVDLLIAASADRHVRDLSHVAVPPRVRLGSLNGVSGPSFYTEGCVRVRAASRRRTRFRTCVRPTEPAEP